MSIERTPHQESDKLKLSVGVRMFEMHTTDENRTKGHALSPSPYYQNSTLPISVPTMTLEHISSSQPLAHYSKCLPLLNLRYS